MAEDKILKIQVDVISRVAAAFSKIRQQTGKLRRSLKITRPTMRGLGAAARKMATTMAGPAARGARRLITRLKQLRAEGGLARRVIGGLGGILRGVLTAGLFAAAGAAIALRGAFSAMYDAMEGGEGVAGALEDVDEQASDAADGLADAADVSQTAAEQAQAVFGAWGKVGEGFVQAQGKILEQTEQTGASAISTAESVAEAMDEAEAGIDGATRATTRFGRAANRISGAFARARRIILQAIAKAITPALEKLAKLLESPEFQKFVDLLAKDLAKAAAAVAKWFIEKVIPAIERFMEQVIEAGGPIEFLKQKWEDFKRTLLMLLAIIVGKFLQASNSIRDKWSQLVDTLKSMWQGLKDSVLGIAQTLGDGIAAIWSGIVSTVTGIWNSFISAIENAVNSVIDIINPFIHLYNAVQRAIGGATLRTLSHVTIPRLQEGGIAFDPMLAVIGDAPSPEVIAPLDELIDILQDTFGAGGMTINVTVPVGTTDPLGFGDAVGGAIATALRRSGQRVPTI